jgi:hypothetical protein
MSTAPATATPQDEETHTRPRNLSTAVLFGLSRQIPRLIHIRRNAKSWMAFRIFLGFAGAALVILPLSLWNSWLAAILGLVMFTAAILLPPAASSSDSDEKARELGAFAVVNGGQFRSGRVAPAPVQLFVGAERVFALDARFQPVLAIAAAEISGVSAAHTMDRWLLQVRWLDNAAEFSYQGIFAEQRARAAESALRSVMRARVPVLRHSRAAGA